MKNTVKPFKHHVNAILSEIDCLTYKYTDLEINDVLSHAKFAFDQDFCDFGVRTIPMFHLQQNFNEMLQVSDNILNDYNNNFFNGTGLKEFLQRYPVLQIVAKTAVRQTESFYLEIDKHIAADKAMLSLTFNHGIPLGEVITVNTQQGDVHNGGKSTAIIEFKCGLKVVYKPRPGAMDVAFNLLLEHLSAETALQFKTAAILDRDDYFWMEFIEYLPIVHKKQIDDYYTRCGALLAVCYLLNGTDFHYENIIAHGEFPVLIDIECLFGATDEMQEGSYSVYNTGLVPLFTYEDENTKPTDSSGFGASGQQVSGIEVWNWEGLNTDALRLCKVKGTFTADTNQPEYNHEKISPEKNLEQIIDGFNLISEWFIAKKDAIDKPGSILCNFKEKLFRVVIRNTVDYKVIMDNSLIAKALFSEEERKVQTFNSLEKFQPFIYLNATCKPKVIFSEYEAIKALNIPLFMGNTSGTALYDSESLIQTDFFKEKPYDVIITKIKNFNNDDVERQVNLIRSAFMLRYNLKQKEKKFIKEPIDIRICNDSYLTRETLEIAKTIKASAIKSGEAYLWNSYTTINNKQSVYNTLGNGFYEGNTGIAYFYNMLSQVTGKQEYAVLSEQIINAEIKRFYSKSYEIDISLATGLAGVIYTLVKSPGSGNLDKAMSLLPLINAEAIQRDKKLDIMGGTAGLLQVLALLYKHTQSNKVLSVMQLAGSHLANNLMTDSALGLRAWKSELFKRPITGYSHGVSGIACALLSLYECSGDSQYKDIFYETLKFEDHFKDMTSSNWQDLRGHNEDCKTAWCHGATGIGMARLHAYKILKDVRLLTDIEMAIIATKKSGFDGTDCYCCGITGRADFLIEADKVLGRPDLLIEAKKLLLQIISRKDTRKYYCTHEIQEISLENPSLFRGVAGIGYTLMRAIDKSKLDCVGLLQ